MPATLEEAKVTTVKFGEGPLGLVLGENDGKLGGVVVGAVRAGGQGEAVGVVPRSVVVGLNGEDVHTWSMDDLSKRLANAPRPLDLKLKTPLQRLEEKTDVLRTQLGFEADFPSDVIIGLAIAHLIDGTGSDRRHLGVRSRAQREITPEELKGLLPEMRAISWTYEDHLARSYNEPWKMTAQDAALKVQHLDAMADACIRRLGISPGGGEDKSFAKEQVQEAGADGLPKPRIFATEMVGGKPWSSFSLEWSHGAPFPPFLSRTSYGCTAPSLIEYPTISELEAMSTEQLQALRFTAIGWKVRGPPGSGAGCGQGLDALKFWRNEQSVAAGS